MNTNLDNNRYNIVYFVVFLAALKILFPTPDDVIGTVLFMIGGGIIGGIIGAIYGLVSSITEGLWEEATEFYRYMKKLFQTGDGRP